MKKVKAVFKVLGWVLAVTCVVCGAIFVPKLEFKTGGNAINENFGGARETASEILELWHVETFEGGRVSRARWLDSRAIEFEKKNPGVFVLIKEFSLDEFLNQLNQGKRAHLYSFSKGAETALLERLSDLNALNINLKKAFKTVGNNGETRLAVPFAYSVYVALTVAKNLEMHENVSSLSSVMFSSGQIKKERKKEKKIYSCVYGGAGEATALLNLRALDGFDEAHELGIFPDCEKLSTYDAYCKFLTGDAAILAGTMRDVIRLENKVLTGAVEDVYFEALGHFTDMVCFLGADKSNTDKERAAANKFIEFVLSEAVQNKVAGLGLLSPTTLSVYESGTLKIIEKQAENIIPLKLFG